MVLDRAVNIDYLFAVGAPSQHFIEKRPFAFAFNDEVDQGGAERNGDQCEIAYIIE